MSKIIKPRLDLMLDIETLGTENDQTLIQLACVAFDIRTGNIISEFNEFIDISKTERGAKQYATKHGYLTVTVRYNCGYIAAQIAHKYTGKWQPINQSN